MNPRLIGAFVAPLAVAGVVVAAALQFVPLPAQEPSQPDDEIPGPAEWVPFEADMAILHANPGHSPTYGRYYRASDGSERLETWIEPDKSRTLVSINNVSASTSYGKAPDGRWTSAPMQLPPDGWHPLRFRARMPGLTLYRFKLALTHGADGSLTAAEGFDAYQFVDLRGDMALLVPELNFFAVLRQSLQSGRREVYKNIKIGEPDARLFVPLPGVSVAPLAGPRGIISGRPNE